MVDFNNDITIGIPAADIERVSILQRRYEWIEAYEAYIKPRLQHSKGNFNDWGVVRARLMSLFLEIQATLKRRLPVEEYEAIKNVDFNIDRENDILKTIFRINEELDAMKLTKVDFIKKIDKTDVTKDNTVAPVRYE